MLTQKIFYCNRYSFTTITNSATLDPERLIWRENFK